jgi:LacI family transcriptional regulator
MGLTIYDIASKAGVSIATVSRVFNDSPKVSAKARESVLKVAAELGYQPHASARNLARRRTDVVSAVIPMISNYFFAEVLRGLQDSMADSEYDLLVFSARTLDEMSSQLDRALHRGRSAGVLLFSAPVEGELEKLVAASKQPVVVVDGYHAKLDSISSDNRQGGVLAADHLMHTGVRNPAVLMANRGSVPARDRLAGFQAGLAGTGVSLATSHIMESMHPLNDGYNEHSGYLGMKALLALKTPPDGVFATSDAQAVGALEALKDAGLECPTDVQVVGYDDLPVARYVGLTTLRQPMYDIGGRSFELLQKRLSSQTEGTVHTVFSPTLIQRQSTRASVPVSVREGIAL